MAEKLVVLDPGHGGKDPGASGPTKKREKDFTLTMAMKVEDILKSIPGITVSLTRRTDVYIGLSDRAKVANRMKADFFVSIHANSYLSTSHGSETFYKKDNSKSAAQILNKAMVSASGLYDRGVKYGNFAVVRETKMPSVLLEVGFISNPEEEKLLFDPAFQDRVALAIAKGICDYMGVKFVVQPEPAPGKPIPVSYPIMEVTVHAEPAQKFEGINVSGTTWLPSRPIGEYLGGKIGYKKGQVTINGTAVETMNIGGTGYVPARALTENVGARLFWGKENPTKVDIYPKEAI
ncbi:N-acetylmuramoyl-L-alanine amidase [Paenibacillus sp. 4624]|uniref:N-acetylmuramoyl-L-alanine amidase n=1 Tax=Paenibacillus sp. 4624 TaxID=3156453 RepID=UPI003D1D1736